MERKRTKPDYVSNGIINVPNILIEYRGFNIKPKLDFGRTPFQGSYGVCQKGYVVTDGYCNVMPAAIWFKSVIEAKVGIDTLIESNGNAEKFWELLRFKQGLADWEEV